MSKTNRSFRMLIILGFIIAIWDFARLFSGWVVASQKEVGAVTAFFFFCGVLPLVGVLACSFHRKWGAWILFVSPWIGALGLLGIQSRKGDARLLLLFFIIPTSILGFVLERSLAKSVTQS